MMRQAEVWCAICHWRTRFCHLSSCLYRNFRDATPTPMASASNPSAWTCSHSTPQDCSPSAATATITSYGRLVIGVRRAWRRPSVGATSGPTKREHGPAEEAGRRGQARPKSTYPLCISFGHSSSRGVAAGLSGPVLCLIFTSPMLPWTNKSIYHNMHSTKHALNKEETNKKGD
jgi:hypothetical protein